LYFTIPELTLVPHRGASSEQGSPDGFVPGVSSISVLNGGLVTVVVVGGNVVGGNVVGGNVVGAIVVGGNVVGAIVVGGNVVGAIVVGGNVVGAIVVVVDSGLQRSGVMKQSTSSWDRWNKVCWVIV